jgi:hypothetical protein
MAQHPQPNPLREWLKIHSVAAGVLITSLFVLAGVVGLFFVNSRFGPTALETGNNTTVQLKVSDHDTNANPNLLPNSLTEGTAPGYTNNVVMEIPRQASGVVPDLFRIQGELIYR